MQNGNCNKCSSNDVFYSDAKGIQHGLSVNSSAPFLKIYKDAAWLPGVSILDLSYYVCQNCGYFETYVLDTEQLAKLDESTNWTRVKRS